MPSELERKLARLEQPLPLDPRRVRVLICPPVSWSRVAAATLLPEEMLLRWGLDSDYIRRDLALVPSLTGWLKDYWDSIGRTAFEIVETMRRTQVSVAVHAGRRDLKQAASGDADVVILVAHHPEGSLQIELADGVCPWPDVESLLAGIGMGRALLVVCSSKQWRDDLRRRYPEMTAAGGGPHKMDFLEGLRVTALFANACDGRRTFEEAWSIAETAYWKGAVRQ